MTAVASRAFGPSQGDVRGANRAITWSVIVHVAVVVIAMVLPTSWFAPKPSPPVMTISLGGTPGPKSTGTTSMGGKTVEQVVPPPKRPEPVKPESKALPPAPMPMPVKTPPRAIAPTESPKPPPPLPPARSLVTGSQIVKGNTAVDTGAKGQGAGLTFGGGGAGGETDLKSFCCPEYLQQILDTIDSNWKKDQPEQGKTMMKFTIGRSGAISNIVVEQGSGSGVLDRVARSALLNSQLPSLPAAYPRDTLTVHLLFPYGTP
jgi:outer membrane biosynthesis protein TonB